jgi:hypothetical protein
MVRVRSAVQLAILLTMLLFGPPLARAQTATPTAEDWARWWREMSTSRAPLREEWFSLRNPSGEPRHWLAAGISVAVIAGSAANSFTESPHESFHFAHEGFFGRDTYAGGADKASHFVDYHFVSKELANFYGVLGYSRGQSILMGAGVAIAAGLVTEIGDGTTFFGFAWEDLLMDSLGAGTAALIGATETADLFGFRRGFIPVSGDTGCCGNSKLRGRDYSNEIYTADLKFAGVAQRAQLNAGPLRYLLFSVTYGSRNYPSGNVANQERLVGFEIGLNLEEILNDVGVRRTTWWGYAAHVVLDNFRVPFTAIGARYDMNHGRWHGPGP